MLRSRSLTLGAVTALVASAANWLPNNELRQAIGGAMGVSSSALLFDDAGASATSSESVRRMIVGMPVRRLSAEQVVSGLSVWMRARPAGAYRVTVGDAGFDSMRSTTCWTYNVAERQLSDNRGPKIEVVPPVPRSKWDERLSLLEGNGE